ncbi:MAG: Adenylate cyclase [Edaphobacter sp.]|jgi:TolB-like protein/Flp pilus assembly protein TadD|nr:Adenylate cyclase [Edaphobacter sp.]
MMPSNSSRLRFGPYELEPIERALLRHGRPVRITPKLFDTLLLLVQHAGHLVSREDMIRAVWKETFVEDGNLAHNVSVLRKILGEGSNGHVYIETVSRHGYRFILPVEEAAKISKTSVSSTRTLRDMHSLAVLPLDNLSGDPEQEYFADGMTEALITGLAQLLPLKVISRTSVVRYRGTQKSLPQIGEELRVDAIVEGTVFRVGRRVRITVQLLDASLDRHLWAATYERDLRDVLRLQRDLAEAIAAEIQLTLNPRKRGSRASARRLSATAYETYLKGRYCWHLRTEEGLKQSIDHYQIAIKKDPEYALAFTGLADSYALCGSRRLGERPPQENMRKAKEAALRGLELDENLADAHLSLATLKFQFDWDWDGAEREFRSAIGLNPNSATSHQRYAMYLATMSRMKEAMHEMECARNLDPLSPIILTATGRLLHFQRRYDEAIGFQRQALAIEPNFVEAHFNLGMIFEQKAMFQQAISEFRKAIRIAGEHADYWSAALGHAYGLAGMKNEAVRILDNLQQLTAERSIVSPFDIAWVHLGLGEVGPALLWMEKALEERCGALVYQNIEPALDPLREDGRFQGLLRRIGLRHD